MKGKLLFTFLAILALTLLMLTACGGDPGTGGGGGSEKDFTVTFVVKGEKTEVGYNAGEMPKYTKKAPRGYTIAGWDKDLVKVTGDATYTAVLNSGNNLSDKLLMEAYHAPLVTRNPGNIEDTRWFYPGYFDALTALLSMTVEEHANGLGGPVADRIAEQVKWCVGGGVEEACDAMCYWPNNLFTAVMALVKDTETVWSKLTEDDIDRLDLIMRAYACMESFASADYNDYKCGPGRLGNYQKFWNANYQLANVPTMLWCCVYLGGADATNKVLNDFDYDTYMAAFEEKGFTYIYERWSASAPENNGGKNIMMDGGPTTLHDGVSAGGTGVGVRPAKYNNVEYTEFTYLGHTLDDWDWIFSNQLEVTFSGGPVRNLVCEGRAYILRGGDENPVLGQAGMMTEFESGDGGGIGRSSTVYCSHDFVMIGCMLRVAEELGLWSPDDDPSMTELIKVGMDDEIYKSIMGYQCVSNGDYYQEHEESEGGYFFVKDMWQKNYSDRTVKFGDWTQYQNDPVDPPEGAVPPPVK